MTDEFTPCPQQEDLVTLRRLTYAVMLRRQINKKEAFQAVEDITTANRHAIDVYAIKGSIVTKIVGEDRWDVGTDFWNEHGMSVDGAPSSPELWIAHERGEAQSIDGVGIQRHKAAAAAGFSSVVDLDFYVERGVSEMRKEQLIAAYAAIEYLLDDMWKSSQPLHYTGLMAIAIEVQKQYWADDTSNPKQDVTIREIREKYGLTEAKAKAVELVACPVDRTKGGAN
jgi:hypothetical protein